MSKIYTDKRGWRYKVDYNKRNAAYDGCGYKVYYTRSRERDDESWWWPYVDPGTAYRATEAEAQADLDALAARKGWRDVADNE